MEFSPWICLWVLLILVYGIERFNYFDLTNFSFFLYLEVFEYFTPPNGTAAPLARKLDSQKLDFADDCAMWNDFFSKGKMV